MNIKKMTMAALLMALCAILSACGTTETIEIDDRGVITTLDVRLPTTAGEILEQAEITLRPGDRLSPSPETELREARPLTVLRESVVQLTAEGRTVTVIMHGGTVADLLSQQGVTLTEGRRLNCDPADRVYDGMSVRVSDSMDVWLTCDGERTLHYVESETVGEALAECAVLLSADDRVTPEADTPLSLGMEILVQRVTYAYEEQEQTVPYETRYEHSEELPMGEERLEEEGRDGLKRVRYRICLVDGEESDRQAVGEELLREPTPARILCGPRDPSQVSLVSRKGYYDCDGSGHGYYELIYSDGSVEYEYF